MSITNAPVTQSITNVSFGFYTPDEIHKLSVKRVHKAETFDMLHNSVIGGVFDPAMGPVGDSERCATCYLWKKTCPGHFGHVQLALPVFQPMTFEMVRKILKSQCWGCHYFLASSKEFLLFDFNTQKAHKKLAGEVFDLKEELLREGDNDVDEEKNSDKDTEEAEEEAEQDYPDLWVDYSSSGAQSIHITAARKKWVSEFFTGSMPAKCARCELPARKLRVEKQFGKIFLQRLSAADQAKLKKQSRNYPSVLGHGSLDPDEDEDESEEEEGDEGLNKKKTKKKAKSEQGRLITAIEAREHLKLLFKKEKEIMDIIFGDLKKGPDGKVMREASAERFFLDVIPIIPNKYRPATLGDDGRYTLHPLNSHFLGIVQSNNELTLVNENKANDKDAFTTKWYELQKKVIALYDSPASVGVKITVPGIKQIIEKKEGMFRTNIMGKRVNFAARTVISPDPYLATNEIGVPEYFAKVLTFPAPVTTFNYQELAKAVLNGPDVHPGANIIEDEFGNRILLQSEAQRLGQSKTLLTPSPNAPPGTCKKVYRHLRTGDYVLMNRQPTLHKPSIMSHRVKVMSKVEKTWRMHYTNCSTYNADFDGDEMNVHFPQTFQGQSEAANIAFTDHQYVVPKSGAPLRGLIQDSVVTGALLTKRDIFLTRGEFQHLVYGALVNIGHRAIETPPPAVWKPARLWTGKQVVTTLLKYITHGQPGINLEASTKISSKLWGAKLADMMREGVVVVRNCELMCGVLDKNQFGASAFGLVHCCYELYGAEMASLLLTTLSRVFILFGQSYGFTCGMDDLLMRPEAEGKRKQLLAATDELGKKVAAQFVERDQYEATEASRLMEAALVSEREGDRLDLLMKKEISPVASSVISACIPNGQVKLFPDNNFSLMTVSGAKGSQVNFSQVSCLLGQQELEGKRVPRMISGRTLPSFAPYDPTARAGGFIMDRFLTGIRPQEFFFHCMAGREGLIDTAVKTSRSGYLQRCVIKHLENLRVHYDYTVRDADNSIVQFLYGEDSLDVMKTGFLNDPKFKFFAMNGKLLVARMNPRSVSSNFDNSRTSKVFKAWKRFDKLSKEEPNPQKPSLDPVMVKYPPGQHLGSVSTKFHHALKKYIETNPDNLLNQLDKEGLTGDEFKMLMYVKYSRCLVDPGEAVGLLAGQSIGEPSTQMTLNTFHLAGRGEANVTLGIPRFREILMTASKEIKTPVMELQLHNPTDKKEMFANMLMRVTLADLVSFITVEESIIQASLKMRQYIIQLHYKDDYQQIMQKYFVDKEDFKKKLLLFAQEVEKQVRKELKTKKELNLTSTKKNKATISQGGEDDEKSDAPNTNKDAGDEEDGATSEKRRRQKKEISYGDDEDEEDKELKKNEDDERSSEDEGDSTNKNDETDETDEAAAAIQLQLDKKGCTFNLLAPLERRKILMLSLVEKTMKKYVVKQIPGISRAMVIEASQKDESGNKQYAIQTEGVNLKLMWNYVDIIKADQIYCNDIWAILQTYGVEMARNAIMREVKTVFNVYDIQVDWRHLGLIADFMTFRGDYKAMNRTGMSTSVSPFQKMSYESCGHFVADAAIYADRDAMSATSSKITVGSMLNSGTGGFDLQVPINPVVRERKV